VGVIRIDGLATVTVTVSLNESDWVGLGWAKGKVICSVSYYRKSVIRVTYVSGTEYAGQNRL